MKIERVLANNPGPFTGPGTNTWLLDDGSGNLVVIDPGPIESDHRKAIEGSVGSRHVVAVLVTHTHSDHAPMANPLAVDLEVPALGHAPGPNFDPDDCLDEGDELAVGSLALSVVATPGHAWDHLCFRVGDVLFSGDHIIGGSSVMVEDMGPYLASLEKLRGTGLRHICPGHGEEIDEPDQVIDWYMAHRRQRHEEILEAIARGAGTVGEIVEVVYADVDPDLHALAARSVQAHLSLMIAEGQIAFDRERASVLPPPTP